MNILSYLEAKAPRATSAADLCKMVLDDVSDDAVTVEVSSPALCAKVLLEADLYIVHKVSVPPGTKYGVGPAQHKQVLQVSTCSPRYTSQYGCLSIALWVEITTLHMGW